MNKEYYELHHLIEQYAPKICTGDYFNLAENAKSETIKNAIKAYAEEVDINNVIGICDFTLFNNGKEGILFTTAGVYIKETLTTPYSFKYSEIESVSMISKGKKDCDGTLIVETVNGKSMTISTVFVNKSVLLEFLENAKVLSEQGMVATNDRYLIIEDMSEEIKFAYISYTAAFADLDNEISPAELNRLYLLMVRIKASSELRQNIMHTINDTHEANECINVIKAHVPVSSLKAVAISLIKDLIVIAGVSYNDFDNNQKVFLNQIMNSFSIDSKEVELIQESIDLEQKYLKGEIDEKKFVKGMQALGANAAAIGFPIAAVYLSGSVVGLSAAGITSGLASLGLGGVLGLSSMVTGVGVVVLIAVAAHAGIKWISNKGNNEKTKNKRELLLAEAMRKNQETINALIADIGILSKDLEECIINLQENEARIRKITIMVKKYSEAAATNNNDNDENKLVCLTD